MINIDVLTTYLKADKSFFENIGIGIPNNEGILRFLDNDSDILAVGHIDTVNLPHKVRYHAKSNRIVSPNLDDRLGIYTLLEVLPKYNIKPDILLTDNEEGMRSTSYYFNSRKEYKWIFELDRRENDVVLYQYENNDMIDLLESYGYEVGIGTYTDICDMDGLKTTCINFGIGYMEQHTLSCYADIWEVETCIKRFMNFYQHEKKNRLPYAVLEKYKYYRPSQKLYQVFPDDTNNGVKVIPDGAESPIDDLGVYVIGYCEFCGTTIFSDEIEEINTYDDYGLCVSCSSYERGVKHKKYYGSQ